MPTILRLFCCALLSLSLTAAEKAAEQFNRDLKDGYEVAALVKGTTSPDGKIAVLYTARKKKLKPADWPVIVPGVVIGQTEAEDGDLYTTENWVVSLADKKKLALVQSTDERFAPVHSDTQLHDGLLDTGFAALWGPEQEGWHYGLLNYDARWGCLDLLLANCDGESARLTSIRATLDTAVRKFIGGLKKKDAKPDSYVVSYNLLAVEDTGASVVGDPLAVRLGFTAEVPKADFDAIEGTLKVKLARNAKGVASASVLTVKTGREEPAARLEPPAKNAVPTRQDFSAFRNEWNEKAKTSAWKVVKKNLPNREKGRELYVRGWIEANVLQRLVHVDSRGEGNESITLYFWRDGQLTSVFQLRKGAATQISEVGEATETYNFVDEKLVAWLRTGDRDTTVDPKDPTFAETGQQVLKDSIKYAAPIYEAIGAD